MIIKPSEIQFKQKKIRMLIAGFPGIGKTTLALSAPKPLYIDVDLSAERVDPEVLNRAAGYDAARTYDELKKDLGMGLSPIELQQVKKDFEAYETIIIDTGGKLQDIISTFGIKLDPKYGQRDGSLSLKGYGWLNDECNRLLNHIIYELDKHVIIIFHAIEEKDGDDTKLRIKAKGSFKASVWELMDIGGFIEMRGSNRTIGFSNCERYFAKGTRGIKGVYTIPELTAGTPNDFVSKLFEEYNKTATAAQEAAVKDTAAYDAIMGEVKAIIDQVEDAESANFAMGQLLEMDHVLTSKKESSSMLSKKAKELGLFYDKVLKAYTPAPEKDGAQ